MVKKISRLFLILFISGFVLALLPILGRTFEFNNTLFWELRVPRVLTCCLAGGGLSVAGLVFQAIFRNDLATPYTLGTASGASLGAVMAIFWGISGELLYWNAITLAAFLGGLIASFFIYVVAQYRKNFNPTTLLLIGVAIGMICSSAILFIQFVSHEMSSLRMIRWLMGGVNVVGMETPLSLAPVVLLSVFFLFFYSGEMNLLSVGEVFSKSRGIDPNGARKRLFILVSFLVAPIVAECGPIGFIGLITPHVVKRWMGSDHRFLILACFLVGGVFLGLCDLFSRILIEDSLIPVGVVTALLGGPFFLWVLLRQRFKAS